MKDPTDGLKRNLSLAEAYDIYKKIKLPIELGKRRSDLSDQLAIR